MLKKITGSFLLAFHNIRSHFFHTLLSILGIVIGVAALVAILSLIDGMKESAVEQMRTTSSLQSVIISHEVYRQVNEVSIRKDSVAIITHDRLAELQTAAAHPVTIYMWQSQSAEVSIKSDSLRRIVTMVRSTGVEILPEAKSISGRLFSAADIASGKKVAVVNLPFAKQAHLEATSATGKHFVFRNDTFEIVGVLSDTLNKKPHVFLPITLLSAISFQENPPAIAVEAKAIEDVNAIKQNLIEWVKINYPKNKNDFSVSSNDFRVKQAEEAFLLFRIVMGLVVGISVIVGGIGVMNVLLISVTQRTQEIGIRKAVGAKRFDIMLQFISESITVSTLGSVVGLILGVLSTMIIVPLIKLAVKLPFEAAYTWDTFILIGIIAIAVGLVFGTYPAIRASRLDPVEAIRRD